MESLMNTSVLAGGVLGAMSDYFTWWQGVLLVLLIILIIVYFQLKKRQM